MAGKTMTYWQDRALQNEAKATALAATCSAREKAMLKKVQANIINELNALLVEVQKGDPLTRTQLWQSKRWLALRNAIEEELSGHARVSIDATEAMLDKVFKQTIGKTMADLGGTEWTVTPETLKAGVVDTAWSGSNYSTRVWKNTKALADRLETDIADLIVGGKSPAVIKKQLASDFAVAYHKADRLIRTESAFVHSEAAKKGYQAAGIEEVEFMAESDCCDICEQWRGKRFPVGSAPIIPAHCYCRCCYAPVVVLNPTTGSNT